MIQDVLMQLHLPVDHKRAQAYDVASNMSGIYNGC